VEEPQPRLNAEAEPARYRRPSRGRILARRVVGLLFLAAVIGALGSAAVFVVGEIRKRDAPPPRVVLPPPPKPLRIVFPEGFTRAQMAERVTAVKKIALRKRHKQTRLTAKAYLAATRSSKLPGTFARDGKRRSLEGFLFPATYDFLPKTTSKQLVARQLEAFRRNWHAVDLRYARSKNLTPYDVLIIASMVEKETLAPSERRLVAAVIYNRLHARMPLGIDATIRYGLHVPGNQPLHESQLQNPTPYNTRLHAGLPPTPIANPGLASMEAAAQPAKVDYLYFVRKPDKVHHFFTATQSEFCSKSAEYGYGGC
jgi:peptidoglycan lytic transglycosylase G